jgi:hypothetical protein
MISRITNQVNSATKTTLSKGPPSFQRPSKQEDQKGKSDDPKADAAAKGTSRSQPKNRKSKQMPKRSNSKKSASSRR